MYQFVCNLASIDLTRQETIIRYHRSIPQQDSSRKSGVAPDPTVLSADTTHDMGTSTDIRIGPDHAVFDDSIISNLAVFAKA